MNKILLFIVMLLLSTMVEAQCYQDRMGKAKAAENAGNYREAKSYYSEATKCEDAKYHNNGEEARKGVARCNSKLEVLTVDGMTSLEKTYSWDDLHPSVFYVKGCKSDWSVKSSDGWCRATQMFNEVHLSLERNLTDYDRETTVVVSSGNNRVPIRIIQKKATTDGDQNYVGICYYNGQGVEKDYKKAVEWYTKSAEQGNKWAQNNLGYCYDKGLGVPQDYKKAVEWYTKSAEQGYDAAQNSLGLCYHNGRGVDKDYTKAVEWYTKSAEQGNKWAQNNLGICYQNGQGVPQDYQKAVEWYTKSAEQGHADAQNNLGWCYHYGRGVDKDYTKAVEWYTKSVEQGNRWAQYNLGWCYQYGQGVEKNIAKAVEWYAKSAKQGNEEAQKKLDELNVKY